MELLRRLGAENKKKVLIVVTHDQKIAPRFSREVRMRDGLIVDA